MYTNSRLLTYLEQRTSAGGFLAVALVAVVLTVVAVLAVLGISGLLAGSPDPVQVAPVRWLARV